MGPVAFAPPVVVAQRGGGGAAARLYRAAGRRPLPVAPSPQPRPPLVRMQGSSGGGGGGNAFGFPGLGGGGGPGGGGGFFDSPLVRAEGQALVKDQDALRRLGHGYGTFDPPGKVLYIQAMEDLFDRWLVMVKRLELSADFTAQLHRRQLLDHMAKEGMTFDQFVAATRHSFAMMRAEVGK